MLSIKEVLKKHTELNKPFIYKVIKITNGLITEKIISNVRLFNDKDIEIFLYFKKEGISEGKKHYKINTNKSIQNDTGRNTIKEIAINTEKNSNIQTDTENQINLNSDIQKLEEKIIDKEKMIKDKDETINKYALSFTEERRDKKIMLEEKEKERQERLKIQKDYNILSNRYNVFKILFIIIFSFLVVSILINTGILTINLK